MDPDDVMVAPVANELVDDELDQGHELCLWADELDEARRRGRMQLLKLATAAWNAKQLRQQMTMASCTNMVALMA